MIKALELLHIGGSAGQLVDVYNIIDKDGDGQIEWEEFLKLGAELIQRGALTGFDEHGAALTKHVGGQQVPTCVSPVRRRDPGGFRATEWKAVEWKIISDRPAVVRSSSFLDSERLGSLAPGTVVNVLETRDLPDGTKRALIGSGWITLVSSKGKALADQSPEARGAAEATATRRSIDAHELAFMTKTSPVKNNKARSRRNLLRSPSTEPSPSQDLVGDPEPGQDSEPGPLPLESPSGNDAL
uniref:EF-hand domain-containing protein n=1 Tax=Haptolina ericina TaxID=156174 RepID=A0A7S3BXP7_9EUKA